MAFSLVIFIYFSCVAFVNSICSSSDLKEECDALIDFGNAMNYKNWKDNKNWMTDETICDWYGISCNDKNHIISIELKDNNLKGTVPESISNLTGLQIFDLSGERPESYRGCEGTNLLNSSLPLSMFTNLKQISQINMEYTCLGGNIPNEIGNLLQLQWLKLHGNMINSTIPQSLNNCKNLSILKLGRNPITGTIPILDNLSVLEKFNCNFCAISGSVPDIMDKWPLLTQFFWDGNNLSGTIPNTIGTAKNLRNVSFNINNLIGSIPSKLCDINFTKPYNTEYGGNGGPSGPCRIGADTNYSLYTANYPWIIPAKGNLYSCPIPKCATDLGVGVCDPTNSPVVCI